MQIICKIINSVGCPRHLTIASKLLRIKTYFGGVFWVFHGIFSIIRHLSREPDFSAKNRIFKNILKCLKACLLGVFWVFQSIFSCDQAALRTLPSVRPSVRLSHLFHYVPIIVSSLNFQEWLPITEVISMQKVKVRGQRSRSHRSKPNLAVSGLWLQFEFTDGYEMMHKAWGSIEEVPYYFSRSSIKFQGHTGQKNHLFWPKFGVSGL